MTGDCWKYATGLPLKSDGEGVQAVAGSLLKKGRLECEGDGDGRWSVEG